MTTLSKDQCIVHASVSLDAFLGARSAHPVGYETVADLIADLGHYCDAHGIAFKQVAELGVAHWVADKAEPGGTAPLPFVALTIVAREV